MNSNLPDVAYQLNDFSALDDLVIWAKQSCTNIYQDSSSFREKMRSFLDQKATTKHFAGPLNQQVEFDPDIVLQVNLPVVIHIDLEDGCKAFLYLTDATTEFHIPERFAVTGNLEEDKRRRALVRGIADGIQHLSAVDWELAEYGGTTTKIDDDDKFWNEYWENVFERVDFEPIGTSRKN